MHQNEQMTSEDEDREKLIANGCVISSFCYFLVSITVAALLFVSKVVEKDIIFSAYADDERVLLIRLVSNLAVTCRTLNMTVSFVMLCFWNPQFRAKVADIFKIFSSATKEDGAQNRPQNTKQDTKQVAGFSMDRINQLPGDRNNSSVEQQVQMRKLIIKQYGAANSTEMNPDDAQIVLGEVQDVHSPVHQNHIRMTEF